MASSTDRLRPPTALAMAAVVGTFFPTSKVSQLPSSTLTTMKSTRLRPFIPLRRRSRCRRSSRCVETVVDVGGDLICNNSFMCGRYRLSRRKEIIEEHFDAISDDEDWSPRHAWAMRSCKF